MKSRRTIPVRVTALASTAILALTGCMSSGNGDSGEGDDDTITIGISLPLTGDFSQPRVEAPRG